MASNSLKLRAVAFISPQNYPMLVKSFGGKQDDELRYHYVAHTSLDIIEERVTANPKATDCFLGMLYVLEDVCVYGYLTPTRVKVVAVLDQTDEFLKDSDMILLFKALHAAYHAATSNPFLIQQAYQDPRTENVAQIMGTGDKWESLRARLDKIALAASNHVSTDTS